MGPFGKSGAVPFSRPVTVPELDTGVK